ncbi:MAG: peptidylprolyl isomerase [Thermosynechococcaceae cyanobacterium MS004]|nr:peptidylprolyl isomerase [Thermosynechococcaceae cyanobacterium MS004]
MGTLEFIADHFMLHHVTTAPIASDEILQQLKITCQLPTVVQAVLERRIIVQAAHAAKISVEPAELQQAADSFRLKYNLSSAKETLTWLQKNMLSIDDLEALVNHTILSTKLANHLFQDKVELYFAERQVDYTQAALYEIVLSNQDLAIELFYAIQEQEITFTEVARQYPQDPEHLRRGGYCGLLARKDMKPEISAAVFAATPPQVLKPIPIGKQVHLIWVEEIISSILDDTLSQKIVSELFADWLHQQTKSLDFYQILDPAMLHITPP